jgi:hypothetical protein
MTRQTGKNSKDGLNGSWRNYLPKAKDFKKLMSQNMVRKLEFVMESGKKNRNSTPKWLYLITTLHTL